VASGSPRTVRVRYLDPTKGTDLLGDALFQGNTVLVNLADGSQALLPYADAQLTVGGEDGTTPILVLITSLNHFVRLYVLDRAIGERLDPQMPADLRRRLANASNGHWWRRLGALSAAAVVVATAAGIWFGTIAAFDLIIGQIPTSVDVAMGKQLITAYAGDKVASDPVVTVPIQLIAERLTTRLPADQAWPFTFQVLPSRTENAFALPGGPIMITSALIAASDSPNEVAGILGHEIQHVMGRHTFHRMAKQLGMRVALSLLVGDNSALTGIAVGARDLIGLSFGRAQEAESDRVGMALANQAGYQADAVGHFFQRMQQKGKQGARQEKALSYLSTHPAHGDRLAQIAQIKGTLPPWGPRPSELPHDWQTVKRHAAAISAKAPEHEP
jgi:Zn-dependent protease with chaperone function